MNVTYAVETFDEAFGELGELFAENHKESGVFPDKIDLNVLDDFYEWSSENGNVRFHIARDDGKVVGYTVTFIGNHPHYQDKVFATNDVLYITPDYRKTSVAKDLIEFVEKDMKDTGVDVMSFHTKCDNPCRKLMESVGFKEDEIQYFKYIKD